MKLLAHDDGSFGVTKKSNQMKVLLFFMILNLNFFDLFLLSSSHAASKFNLNDLGAIEQIICAHGRRFIGTYFSTFSAHILRLRGYLPFETIQKEHLFWDQQLPKTSTV
jgi:uncharacterized membrane protein